MANTENIEAKLCAYIDGDLDAQGRAEIEKHLAANPQHRTLIEQLSKQRDLLRELPRENAPEEILDALQSQMERSVLLGDDDAAQEAAAMKIHRWPQLMAAAAIVVLTVGLGLVIYFVLPGNSGDTNYAVMTKAGATLEDGAAEARTESGSIALGEPTASDMPSPTSPSKMAAAGAATPSASADAIDRAALSKSADKSAALADAAGSDALRKDKAADVFAPAAPMVGELAMAPGDLAGLQRQLQNADLAKQLKSTAPGGIQDNPMFVIVSTADPSATRSEVTNYLATNKIAWDSVSHPTPELQVAQNQAVNLSRSQSVNVRMKNGDVQQQQQQQQQQPEQAQTQTTQAPQQQEWSGLGETQQKKFEGKSAAGAAAAEDSASRANTGAGAGSAQAGVGAQPTQGPAVQEQVQQRLESAAQAPAAEGGAQPGLADSKQRMSQRPNEVTSNVIEPDEGLLQATTQAPKQQVQDQKQMRVVGQPATESRLIIARGMTKQQAVELQSNLSKQTTVQRAAVYEPRPLAMKRELSPFGGGDAAATKPPPTTEPLPTYKELEARLLAGAPATTAPATPADAGGWRDSDAPVASRQAADPAGAATTQDALSGAIATTGPSTSSGQGPTTLPLGSNDALSLAVPTTGPAGAVADERLDVVILVEDDAQLPAAAPEVMVPNAAPNAAPTTEPSPAPTTQPAPDATPAP